MRRPIRSQFMTPLLVVAVGSLAAVALLNAWITTRETRAQVEGRVRGVARVLSEGSFPLTDGVLRQMGELAGAEFVLTRSGGEVLATSSGAVSTWSINERENPMTVREPDSVKIGPMVTVGRERYFHSALWLDRPGSEAQTEVLHLLISQRRYNAAWRSAFAPPLAVAVASAAAVAAVTGVVSQRISSYLGGLSREVTRIAGGDFSPVVLPKTDDELLDLAASVNQMATRLADYESGVRRTERLRTLATLGAGLAHEVRNAATGCRLAIDLHEAASPPPPADGESRLAVARLQLDTIEARMRQLLRLGRESGPAPSETYRVGRVVSAAVGLVRGSADHAGVELRWSPGDDDYQAFGDADALSQAVVNLLLNAVEACAKHAVTAEGRGTVRVDLCREADRAVITVSDNGRGPNDRVAEALFEPLVSDKPEGIGLGLAVARQAVESSGGDVSWRREASETVFALRIPLIPSEAKNAESAGCR